jgi:hypothetical protein
MILDAGFLILEMLNTESQELERKRNVQMSQGIARIQHPTFARYCGQSKNPGIVTSAPLQHYHSARSSLESLL